MRQPPISKCSRKQAEHRKERDRLRRRIAQLEARRAEWAAVRDAGDARAEIVIWGVDGELARVGKHLAAVCVTLEAWRRLEVQGRAIKDGALLTSSWKGRDSSPPDVR